MGTNPVAAIELGNTVFSSDHVKLGSVSAIHESVIHVEKGFFFVKDYSVPHTAIARVDAAEGEVYLSVTKDQAAHKDWEIPDKFESDYDSPLDGDGYSVLAGAAAMPNPMILEETDEPLPDEKIEDYQ